MMNLGTTNGSRVRKEIRTCKHPGCGKKFEGSPTSLYCLDHRTRKSRAERFVPREEPKPEESNLVVDFAAEAPCQKSLHCSLAGCEREYTVTLYPDHSLYPMYCESHRTEYKRKHFLRMRGSGRHVPYEAPRHSRWSDYERDFEVYSLNQPHVSPFGGRRPR